MVSRILVALYGLASYIAFLLTFVYAIGFVGNWPILPRTIDGDVEGPFATSLMVDVGLLLLFATQHSAMARRGFKDVLTRFIPQAAERSTFVLFSSAALATLFSCWRPLGGLVWRVEGSAALALMVLAAAGWLLVLASTFLINHWDLFGLRQVWLHLRGQPYGHLRFRTPGPYRVVRHPLYAGFIIAFWSTPVMTLTHLLFAVVTTGYIVVAIQLEERDLLRELGRDYAQYRRRVPMLLPRLRSRDVEIVDVP
ncbi:methanethiol S-methyltransferase [Dokdonella sp.]|uniref:methanethiol S-methyltransferase n=1 Tax=Dokdonella sp. TaxID=2291710 RepID=UPI002F3F0E06